MKSIFSAVSSYFFQENLTAAGQNLTEVKFHDYFSHH